MQVLLRPFSLPVSLSRVLLRLWHLSLYALVLILPFELVTPWLAVRDVFVVTNVELIVFLSLGLWLVYQISGGGSWAWIRETPLTLPFLLLLGALVISALLAPSHQRDALKTVARWLTGVAVAYMFIGAVRSGLPVWRLLQVSVIASVGVALVAVAEVLQTDQVVPLLFLFRETGLFRVGGEIRASATLTYSTIAALYLEINFIFVVGLLARAWQNRERWQIVLLAAALLLLGQALIFTLTRSAFAAIALALVLCIVIRFPRHRLDLFARTALAAGAALALLLCLSIFTQPATQLRFASESDRTWYRAVITPASLPVLHAGEQITVAVQLTNTGSRPWAATGNNPVFVFYHWLAPDGKTIVVQEGLRTVLPRDLAPNETITLDASLLAPPTAGDYMLAWDMVRQDLFWFSTQQATAQPVPLRIEPGAVVSPSAVAPTGTIPSYTEQSRGELWRSALEIFLAHPLLGVGPGNFRFIHSEDGRAANVNVHANNTYLEMLADSGIFGAAAFLFFLVVLARLGWHALHQPSANSLVCATLAAALAAFWIHGVTDYFLEFTSTYVLLWLIIGLLAGLLLPPAPPSLSFAEPE